MRTANHASPAKGIRKTKLQGSDAQSSKTLQSQNSLQEKKRFQLNRLTVLHDRLASLKDISNDLASFNGGTPTAGFSSMVANAANYLATIQLEYPDSNITLT